MLGWRVRDLDLAYLPFLAGKGIAQYVSDPVFLADFDLTMGLAGCTSVAEIGPGTLAVR
jgi:hypothetical protein